MWGNRVIRAGVLLAAALVIGASAGCCESCQNLWKGDAKPQGTQTSAPQFPQQVQQGQPGQQVQQGQQVQPWQPGAQNVSNIPTNPVPERAYGGIQ